MLKAILFILMLINENHASAEIITVSSQDKIIAIPESMEGIKRPTLNGNGYVFYSISPMAARFIDEECKPERVVIDIGSGYSNIPIEALKRGVSDYVANDILEDHLKILSQRVKEILVESALKKLTLMRAKAPQELPISPQKYDAILADKVIHFMKPNEILEFIEWSKASLKKGGKMYVMTSTPYSTLYNKMLPEYLKRIKENKDFPGHFTDVMSNCNAENVPTYNHCQVPDEMVLFSRTDLIKLFEKQGMKVVDSYSLKVPKADQAKWQTCADEESNLAVVIVENGK
jgi:16S rRNA G966 N2-methylase RsmD